MLTLAAHRLKIRTIQRKETYILLKLHLKSGLIISMVQTLISYESILQFLFKVTPRHVYWANRTDIVKGHQLIHSKPNSGMPWRLGIYKSYRIEQKPESETRYLGAF